MESLFDLSGKVALVTGASSGMGKAIALALGIHGARLIISSNDEVACQATLDEMRGHGIAADYILCDVSDMASIDQLVSRAIDIAGRIDVLVSCVGIAIPGSSLDANEADFEKTMDINLKSAIRLSNLAIPEMIKRKDGVIIFLASIAGIRGNKQIGLYGLSKAGLIQWARNLAVEWGPSNIRVNSISPGMIDTRFAEPMTANKEFMEKRLALTPLRRIGQPHEVAGVAVMLASRAGAFITGQNIIVDGGTVVSDGN